MLSSINEGGIGHCAWELGFGCRFWQISSGGCLLSLGGGLAFGACFSGGGGVGGAGGGLGWGKGILYLLLCKFCSVLPEISIWKGNWTLYLHCS